MGTTNVLRSPSPIHSSALPYFHLILINEVLNLRIARSEIRRVSFAKLINHFSIPSHDPMMPDETNHYRDGAVPGGGGVLCNSLFHTALQMSTLRGELCKSRRLPATHCQTVHFSFSLPGWCLINRQFGSLALVSSVECIFWAQSFSPTDLDRIWIAMLVSKYHADLKVTY